MQQPRRPLSILLAGGLAVLLAATTAAPAAAATALADQPLVTSAGVPGNLALPLSVEFPTAVSVAHYTNTYDAAQAYLGYFDPDKCYVYTYVASETATSKSRFDPSSMATNHVCSGKWSGNFLNWATMQTIDPFRWAMTGGYRAVDTSSLTILEKAWASGQGGTGNFPDRTLGSSLSAGATPWASTALKLRIQGLGNKLRFTITGDNNGASTPASYTGSGSLTSATVYEAFVRVKVCDASLGTSFLEANCKQYSGGYKPEGLIQRYADRIRFSVFGYLNDSNLQRDGGVLRARQKFVGPQIIVPGQPSTANPNQEWDPSTGVYTINPDPSDATGTNTLFGIATVTNSGVMNYINKFGQAAQSYKTYDPVGELYYAALRYFRHIGNVSQWSDTGTASTATKQSWADGFPVITNWDDPIQYSCQKNFVLGMGDVNTHADKNVPGPTPTVSEPAKPAAVSADTVVDAVSMTNKVGVLQGISNLGTTTPYNGCCTNNSALMAGLAYDAHTRDIRPDIPNVPGSIGQTVDTYWVDVLEFQTFKPNNQFLLAAKYGGFTVPSGYNPQTNTTPLPQSQWYTTTDILPDGTSKRPDNYFVASRPDQMVSGLNSAFARIAASLRSFTTSFSTSLPQVAISGNASFAAQYDSSDWSGEIIANSLSFDPATGAPSQTQAWKLTTKLATQFAGTGWNTNRRVVTWNGSGGIPFRYSNLAASQKTALDTSYVAGDDSSNYLNYLRGDQTNEQGSTAGGSTHAYRTRTRLLGDISGSKAEPNGPPSLPFADATNPGYSVFKTTWANRPTVVYVGANDGMLHAIDGSLSGPTAGNEIFSYVPASLFQGPGTTPSVDGLAALGNPSFVHHYYVNASPIIRDIDLGNTSGGSGTNWRSVLIGGLGKGGRSYYAIDVTDPASITSESAAASKVMWEFTDPDMGFTYGAPAIVKTRKYGWVVIFPSGYNNADGRGYFFIVNPRNGQLLEKISTGAGSVANSAGLATLDTFVLDATDGTADAVYAGDLLGNVWRWDLTAASGLYPTPLQLAVVTDSSGNPQPITSSPLIEVQPGKNKRHVMFGTGRLLDTSDNGDTQTQTFYAFVDGTSARFNSAGDLPSGVSFPLRRSNLVLNNVVNGLTSPPAASMGWYVDLGNGAGGVGWRVITTPTTFFGVVAWSPMLPSGDTCNPSGSSSVYAVSFGTGKTVLSGGVAYVSFNGVVTDLRFYSVTGTPRLIAGDDQGTLSSVPGNFGLGTGVRRLNWREVPIVD